MDDAGVKNMKFTIVTVCYNAEKNIEATIRSLLEQTCDEYEYIIKDGLSSDSTLKIVYSLLENKRNIHIISSPDTGIYDAMNQALEIAQGEYVFFLNAGDCFADENVLAKIRDISAKVDGDILYGNVYRINESGRILRRYGAICKSKFFFSLGDCICHQALFARKELFEKRKFDLTYKVCADREWQLFYIDKNVKMIAVHFVIANVQMDGFSNTHIEDLEQETQYCLDKYCMRIAWLYKWQLKIKKNQVVSSVLHLMNIIKD